MMSTHDQSMSRKARSYRTTFPVVFVSNRAATPKFEWPLLAATSSLLLEIH